MPKKNLYRALLLLLPISIIAGTAGLPAFAKTLNGNASQTDMRSGPSGPAMSRSDINKSADPFAGAVQQADPLNQQFEAPKSDVPMPPPQKNFSLNAQDQGVQPANFQQMQPSADSTFGRPDNPPQVASAQTTGNPNDPDSNNQALQLAWDQWHHNVASAVYQRYTTFSNMAFTKSPPLSVTVSYTVSNTCQVSNIRIQQKSPNFLFNTLILTVIKSLNGDASLLTFPQGSRRQSVEKAGTFSVNTGIEGFKYLTGDKETINQRR